MRVHACACARAHIRPINDKRLRKHEKLKEFNLFIFVSFHNCCIRSISIYQRAKLMEFDERKREKKMQCERMKRTQCVERAPKHRSSTINIQNERDDKLSKMKNKFEK